MDHFGLSPYFKDITGATLNSSRSEKADVLAYAIKKSGLKDKREAVMTGDRKHDIAGAKANGVSSVGVLYGFGSNDELKSAGAVKLIKSPKEIITI